MVVSFNPQVMGGGGDENNDELWTEIFNIPVIVLFLFSERKTCLQRLIICYYSQPYKLWGGGLVENKDEPYHFYNTLF